MPKRGILKLPPNGIESVLAKNGGMNKKKNTKVCRPNPEKCKKCGACLRPGCPALTKNEDGTISIDETMCNGCGLCMNLCKFDAIELVEV